MIIDAKILKKQQQQQKISKPNSTILLKGSYTMIKWDLFQGCKDDSISTNQGDTKK